MRCLLCLFICLLFSPNPALADEPASVKALLQEKIDAVVLILQDKGLDRKTQDDQIIEIVTPIFDFQTMAKLSLGKKYWPGLNERKKDEFSDLFTKRMQESYLEKLHLYTDEKVIYEEPLEEKRTIHIPTSLLSKDDKISMIYKFYQSKTGWKIYDVEIAGVSVIQTYRSQFDGVLKQGTIDDLLAKLNVAGEFVIPTAGEDSQP